MILSIGEILADLIGEKNDGDNDLAELFAEVSGKKKEDISFCDMGSEDAPALISIEEESRRMADMMKVYGLGGSPAVYEKLVVNSGAYKGRAERICRSERKNTDPHLKKCIKTAAATLG